MTTKLNADYITAFKVLLDKLKFHYEVHEKENTTMFSISSKIDNYAGLNTRIIMDQKGTVQMRSYLANNVPESKHVAVMKTLNRLIDHYRFVRFCIDRDGDVCATYDIVLRGDETEGCDQIMFLLHIFINICDECIPDIMKTIWNASEKPVAEEADGAVNMNLFNKNGGKKE